MRHLVYTVTYSVVPIDSSLLTVTLRSVRATVFYNDTEHSGPFVTLYQSSTVIGTCLPFCKVFFEVLVAFHVWKL